MSLEFTKLEYAQRRSIQLSVVVRFVLRKPFILNPLVPLTVSACDPTRAPRLGPVAGSVSQLGTVNGIQTWTPGKTVLLVLFSSTTSQPTPVIRPEVKREKRKKRILEKTQDQSLNQLLPGRI